MATHYLRIINRSDHPQTFQCHGYNGDKNLTIKARGKANIPARDGTSGAIIAVHDGIIGEQCEITKAGWNGNDTIDISNIVGAGGNLTCQQVGDPAGKFKGHETFMQACNNAWKKLPQAKRDQLRGKHVFLGPNGNVKRIGPPKNFRPLEEFVRTFANCRTYIGVGAWGDSKGNPCDNKQSAAGKGSKDILIVYSDGNAAPDPKKPFTGQTVEANAIMAMEVSDAVNPEDDSVADGGEVDEKVEADESTEMVEAAAAAAGEDVDNDETAGVPAAEGVVEMNVQVDDIEDADQDEDKPVTMSMSARSVESLAVPGPGIMLTNKSPRSNTYFFFENYWNGDGTGGANFDKPLKHVIVGPNKTVHVPLKTSFKGRVQRGDKQPATWGEFQVEAANDKKSHGDISIQQGCDGSATVASTDGTNVSNGFVKDIIKPAPAKAKAKKPNGEVVLDHTEPNWNGPGNKAAIDWAYKQLGKSKAYIVGGSGVNDVASKNKCLHFTFYVRP